MKHFIVTVSQAITTAYDVEAEDRETAIYAVLDGEATEIPNTYDNETDYEVEEVQ